MRCDPILEIRLIHVGTWVKCVRTGVQSCRKWGTVLSELGYSVSELGYSVSELGYSVSELGYSVSELGYSVSELRYSPVGTGVQYCRN